MYKWSWCVLLPVSEDLIWTDPLLLSFSQTLFFVLFLQLTSSIWWQSSEIFLPSDVVLFCLCFTVYYKQSTIYQKRNTMCSQAIRGSGFVGRNTGTHEGRSDSYRANRLSSCAIFPSFLEARCLALALTLFAFSLDCLESLMFATISIIWNTISIRGVSVAILDADGRMSWMRIDLADINSSGT